MKSILVIGMGIFGTNIAKKMLELGNDIMIVDKDEDRIQELSPFFTNSFVGDCKKEGVIRSLGVNNFDICFVAIGDDFQSSLEITALLKELGATHIVSKTCRESQAKLLKLSGADEIVFPEREIAERLAVRYNAENVFDFVPITSEYSIYEILIPKDWINKSISELNVRGTHKVNILAVKCENYSQAIPEANYVFKENDHIVVMGRSTDVFKLSARA